MASLVFAVIFIRRFEPRIERFAISLVDFLCRLPRVPRRLISPEIRVLPEFHVYSPDYVFKRLKFTLFMIFLNVYTFVFTNDFQGHLNPQMLFDRGFSYENFAQHRWFVLLTSNFLHFNIPHLTFNMTLFLIFGGAFEVLMGSRLAAIVFLVAMNSNLPSGLFLLPVLRLYFPHLWSQTVQFVDVGASLGVLGSIGAFARLLVPKLRISGMVLTVAASCFCAVYFQELIGFDHAFSALIGYFTASYFIRKKSVARQSVSERRLRVVGSGGA